MLPPPRLTLAVRDLPPRRPHLSVMSVATVCLFFPLCRKELRPLPLAAYPLAACHGPKLLVPRRLAPPPLREHDFVCPPCRKPKLQTPPVFGPPLGASSTVSRKPAPLQRVLPSEKRADLGRPTPWIRVGRHSSLSKQFYCINVVGVVISLNLYVQAFFATVLACSNLNMAIS